MRPLSPRDLAELSAPFVARATKVIRAASEAHPAARRVEASLRGALGVRPDQITALWIGLDRAAPRALCADLELRLEDRAPVLVSVRRAAETERAAIRTGHFALSLRARRGEAPPPGLRAIAEHLQRVDPPGEPSAEARALLDAFAEQERLERDEGAYFEDVSAPIAGQEEDSITLLQAEYARHFGEPPALRTCLGAPGPSMIFPARDLPDAGSFFTLPDLVRRSPSCAAYLRRLGYACDDGGCLRTVPLPSTFIAARHSLGLDGLGLTPVLVARHSMACFDRRWLASNTRAELAINLGTRLYYALARPVRSLVSLLSPSIRQEWISHFTTLGHDMSIHLLSTHLVPRVALFHIGERARAAMRRLPRARPLAAPRPLLEFYDTDLFLYARERWERVDKIEDLPAALAAEDGLGDLLDRLERRISDVRGSASQRAT